MDRRHVVTTQEYSMLKRTALEMGEPLAHTLIVFSWGSGIEMIPILKLRWSDIDFERMEIHQDVNVTVPLQTGSELHDMLLSMRAHAPRGFPWVIFFSGGNTIPIRKIQAYVSMKKVIDAAGLKVKFSDLRKAFLLRAIKGSHSFGAMPSLPNQVELAEIWENSKPREPEPVAKSMFPKIITPPEIR